MLKFSIMLIMFLVVRNEYKIKLGKENLCWDVKMTNLWRTQSFLEVDWAQYGENVLLRKSQLVISTLDKFGMSDCGNLHTPIESFGDSSECALSVIEQKRIQSGTEKPLVFYNIFQLVPGPIYPRMWNSYLEAAETHHRAIKQLWREWLNMCRALYHWVYTYLRIMMLGKHRSKSFLTIVRLETWTIVHPRVLSYSNFMERQSYNKVRKK